MRCMTAASTCSHQISFLHSEHDALIIFCFSNMSDTRISLLPRDSLGCAACFVRYAVAINPVHGTTVINSLIIRHVSDKFFYEANYAQRFLMMAGQWGGLHKPIVKCRFVECPIVKCWDFLRQKNGKDNRL